MTPRKVFIIFCAAYAAGAVTAVVGAVIPFVPTVIVGAAVCIAAVLFHGIFYRCPHCGRYLGRITPSAYCRHCGKKIDE